MVLGVNLVDIYCFQDKHPGHVADASGSDGYLHEQNRIESSKCWDCWVKESIYQIFNEMILLDFRCRVCVLVGLGVLDG